METSEKRQEKVMNWLKKPENILLLIVLIFSFVVLVYYFNLTKSQPLWWDESEYMAAAKEFAFNIPAFISPQRPPLFQFLASLLYRVGLNELPIKFILVLLPAWLAVLFIFLLVKEMYNNSKLAFVAAFILSVSWIHLFYASRVMTDPLGFLFGMLAFYCFYKGYVNNKGKYFIWLIGFFVALSFMIRLTGILYGVVIIIFLLFTDKFRFLKNKHLWIALLIAFLTISPYLIWANNRFHDPFAFRSGYTGLNAGGTVASAPFGWWMLGLVYDYPELVFFFCFLIGLITLIPMILSLDLLVVKNDKKMQNDFFILFSFVFTLLFFMYFLRLGENRWLMLMSIGIFIIAAKGIIFVYDHAKKNMGKSLAILIVIVILTAGAYFQLNHLDGIVKAKITSYQPVKEAGLWIKQNSDKSDKVITASLPQNIYYSERESFPYPANETNFTNLVKEVQPRFLVVSSFEQHQPWISSWLQKNQNSMTPVNAWFSDIQQKQPILVIYEFKDYSNITSSN